MPFNDHTVSTLEETDVVLARSIIGLALLAIGHGPVAVRTGTGAGLRGGEECQSETARGLQQGLAEVGYVEGKTVRIEHREAVLDAEYHGAVADLIDRKVDIIVAANVAATVAAARATTTIPIVMLAVNDPVGIGAVKSLARPGTNVTGTTLYAPQLIGERLRILKRLVPDLDKAVMVLNGNNANNAGQFELLRAEAGKLGIAVQALDIRKPEDVDAAFEQARAFGAKAFVNAVDTFINSRRFALAAGLRSTSCRRSTATSNT